MMYVGIDTSCYTTSFAVVENGRIIADERIILDVKQGERGLRQSDAIFLHTRNLTEIFRKINFDFSKVKTISVSNAPRNVVGSYMPVFMSGVCAANAIRAAIGCDYKEFSHQQGHIMAGLYSANALHIKSKPFIAIHISGGTTEMLLVDGDEIDIIGKTLDISAGQLVDRIGVKLGVKFPCGREMDLFAQKADKKIALPVSVKGLDVNFSGAEAKAMQSMESKENIAMAVFECIAKSLLVIIQNANEKYQIDNILVVGGVAANSHIRNILGGRVFFATPQLSSDNAVGTALLGAELGDEKA